MKLGSCPIPLWLLPPRVSLFPSGFMNLVSVGLRESVWICRNSREAGWIWMNLYDTLRIWPNSNVSGLIWINPGESECVCGRQREFGAGLSESEWIWVRLTGSEWIWGAWVNLNETEGNVVKLSDSELDCMNPSKSVRAAWTWVNLNEIEQICASLLTSFYWILLHQFSICLSFLLFTGSRSSNTLNRIWCHYVCNFKIHVWTRSIPDHFDSVWPIWLNLLVH